MVPSAWGTWIDSQLFYVWLISYSIDTEFVWNSDSFNLCISYIVNTLVIYFNVFLGDQKLLIFNETICE
jgi:hypothetical protein